MDFVNTKRVVKMKLKEIAQYIENKLLEQGFIIHRYDSYSTNSIYLKLDYGVMNSIRISDHKGKQHLSYKYNIESGVKVARWYKDNRGFWRYNCSTSQKEIDKLIEIILDDKNNKLFWGVNKYNDLMLAYKQKGINEKGFWQQAREIRNEWLK